jgi:hypothetical protein
MRQEFFNLELNTNGQRLYEFTNQTIKWLNDNEFNNGINVSDTISAPSNSSDEDCQFACDAYFNNNTDISLYYCNWLERSSTSTNYCYLFATCDFTWVTTQDTINDIIEARIWNMWDIDAKACPTQAQAQAQAPTNNTTVNPILPSAALSHAPAPAQPPSSLYFILYTIRDKKQTQTRSGETINKIKHNMWYIRYHNLFFLIRIPLHKKNSGMPFDLIKSYTIFEGQFHICTVFQVCEHKNLVIYFFFLLFFIFAKFPRIVVLLIGH